MNDEILLTANLDKQEYDPNEELIRVVCFFFHIIPCPPVRIHLL